MAIETDKLRAIFLAGDQVAAQAADFFDQSQVRGHFFSFTYAVHGLR
jgi:hypothetical protein